ncbi:MAG: hypothetical protein ABJA78_12905 [Ferruginibacter sp.]
MKYFFSISFIALIFFSCNNAVKTPDVSGIQINLSTQRFEQDFFKADTNHMLQEIDRLQNKYPGFMQNFMLQILNTDPHWSNDSVASYVKHFLESFQAVYDTAEQLYSNFSPYENAIRKDLQFVKYYFPNYPIPKKIITYIGPLDGFGDIISPDALMVGLHLHLGRNSDFYKSTMVQETYPEYISRQFEPEFISINTTKNIVNDMYPEKGDDLPLVQLMVERGKKLYLLSKLLPYVDENKLIGYSKEEMEMCRQNERVIWDLFLQNNYLQVTDKNIVKNYIGESPKTQEIVNDNGGNAPGNIGSYAGWQIVKKYMGSNPSTKMPDLMAMDPEQIYQQSKYKP